MAGQVQPHKIGAVSWMSPKFANVESDSWSCRTPQARMSISPDNSHEGWRWYVSHSQLKSYCVELILEKDVTCFLCKHCIPKILDHSKKQSMCSWEHKERTTVNIWKLLCKRRESIQANLFWLLCSILDQRCSSSDLLMTVHHGPRKCFPFVGICSWVWIVLWEAPARQWEPLNVQLGKINHWSSVKYLLVRTSCQAWSIFLIWSTCSSFTWNMVNPGNDLDHRESEKHPMQRLDVWDLIVKFCSDHNKVCHAVWCPHPSGQGVHRNAHHALSCLHSLESIFHGCLGLERFW